MKRFFKNFRFAMLGVSILCIALGAAMLLYPAKAETVLKYGFGAVLVLSGLLQVVSYLVGERGGLLQKLMLLSGAIAAVLGVWVLLTGPEIVKKLVMIVMGIVLLYHGAMDVKYGFDVKAAQGKTWGAVLFFGVATCAVGVLMLVNPFEDPALLFTVAGLGFLFDGVTDLFTVFSVAGAKARYERISGAAPVIELEPGAAQVVPVDGNTADTPVLAEPETPAEPAEAIPETELETVAAAAGDAGE